MFRNASWGAIGVRVGFEEGLDLAREIGFEGADVPVHTAAEYLEGAGAAAFAALYADRGLKLGSWGLPVNWRGDKDKWRADLEAFPRLCAAAQAVGAPRCATWIPPSSNELDFAANFAFHVERFTPVAAILGDHGCRLGLEFIGPKTLRAGAAHEFVYDLPGMMQLCRAIGPNVGLLLDCWHWYTSGGTAEQLAGLTAADVVLVHVNDAPAGVPLDQQIDNQRCLPVATGVIDSATFMRALRRMAYDGPVSCEPFNAELNAMEDRAAAARVKESLDTLFALAG